MHRLGRLMPVGHMVAVRRHQARRICAVTLVMSLSLFVASPFVTLWSVSSALQANDMRSLGSFLNWRAVRTSLKTQLVDSVVGTQPVADDELPEFGSSFATAAVSNAVDLNVNPDNLGSLVGQVMPAAPAIPVEARVAILHHVHVRFVRPDMFEASIAVPGHEHESPLHLQMRIQGWRWKITRVDLPSAHPDHPIMEASAESAQKVLLAR
ncbi:DUF2939 domain-containing protein [Gluconacetobacter johannae]|uniref:DUF2939 domain-containing protein n=2 Tax=Gluconacetobacter johannae TaxID=112140 RepID=A0A7W4J4N1_9PROT|nr:DUF2939 domain-containing protein [Gluconacetobacter johannae]